MHSSLGQSVRDGDHDEEFCVLEMGEQDDLNISLKLHCKKYLNY